MESTHRSTRRATGFRTDRPDPGAARPYWWSDPRPRDRQLRQLRLQPRAVPRRARCGTDRGRNDQLTVDEAVALAPDAVLLSPGPGRPETSGIICDSIGAFAAIGTPVFGVCLGHQAIGHVYGADVVGAPAADARQDLGDPARRHRRVQRSRLTADRDPLSLADPRAGQHPRRPDRHGPHRGRRGDGCPSSRRSRSKACSSTRRAS